MRTTIVVCAPGQMSKSVETNSKSIFSKRPVYRPGCRPTTLKCPDLSVVDRVREIPSGSVIRTETPLTGTRRSLRTTVPETLPESSARASTTHVLAKNNAITKPTAARRKKGDSKAIADTFAALAGKPDFPKQSFGEAEERS